jgi:hypothetical protein
MATKTYKIDIDVESKTLGQLEDELGQINDELKQVDRNSEAFANLSKKSQVLTAEIEKTNNAINGIQLEDKLQAADGAIKVFGGSLQTVVGTLGTLGIESEVFGEFEEKAASAIAVGMGIKDVSEGFGQFTQVMKKSGIAAKLFGSTTSKALIATGIGAFIVALGTVIAYWDDIVKGVDNFTKKVPFVGKAIDAVKGAFDTLFDAARPVLEFLGILPDEAERAQMAIVETSSEAISQLERELAVAQAAGESAKELYDLRKRLLEEELVNLRAAGAEKEEIFRKETELLALNAAEQKRIRDEMAGNVVREKVTTVNAIQKAGTFEIETQKIVAQEVDIVNQQELANREAYIQQSIINQQKLDAARQMSLDNVIAIAGAESKVGRAALIAKQILLAKELIAEAKSTLTFSTLKASEATVATATGAAKTAAIGFPQNIPLLIAYAAQAAGIIAAVVSAVKGAKSATKGVGGGSPSVNIPTPRGAAAPTLNLQPQQAPEPQLEATPTVRAYVLSGDATTAQEADAKLNARRTLG